MWLFAKYYGSIVGFHDVINSCSNSSNNSISLFFILKLNTSKFSSIRLLLDDFGILVAREQMLNEKKWFAERNYNVCELPTGQAFVIKF